MSIAQATPTIQLLQDEWQRVSHSEELLASVKKWTYRHPLLAYRSASEIISFVVKPSWNRERKRDEALSCILEHSQEPLSQLTVLQSLLPQVTHLIDKTWTHNADEFAAYVVAMATELIAGWKKRDIICVHWWLYRNIQSRVTQNAQTWQKYSRQETQLDDQEIPEASSEPGVSLPDLIALVMQQGELDRLTAELVVLTRTGCLTVETISHNTGLKPQTLRRKRLRAEQRLRSRLSLADFL